ncbi:hypothetical protein [Chryseobacterium sp. EO14]|uniref:hypothetical protein n=1 Tax=Chryseobacterium sp. EO14 TaxID=2950551 RepID=UPI0021091CAD|nr:hypothetical protein [Chryseobacterium sp. EO14]MCQ4139190.1 hypothetical protein [Chryseobacterium sp. EO14]
MNIQLTEKDAREIQAYLKTIQTYSALVEAKLNKACQGGVGTTLNKQSKRAEKIEAIRIKFHK